MKPNLLCVGNVKAGSTSLWDTLAQHPQIFMAKNKEVHFFDRHYEKGFDWYESHFEEHTNQKIVGEVTPNYMYQDLFLERVYNYFDKLKVIVLIRNPVERVISHHQMFYASGHNDRWDKDKNILDSKWFNWYIEKTFCYDRIIEMEKKYDVLCIQTEKLNESYTKIQEWLGVDVEELIPRYGMVNENKFNVDIKTKEYVLSFFTDEILKLEQHLGWDLKDYKTVK